MKKKEYQVPETDVITVVFEDFVCVSGKIKDWSLEKDDSDDDDWSDE